MCRAEWPPRTEGGAEHVDAAADESDYGLVMAFSLAPPLLREGNRCSPGSRACGIGGP
jgi:hypothetical protein